MSNFSIFKEFNFLGLTMQQSGGGGGVSYTARFGTGSDNGSGTGAFNTALYSGAPPADGTYGAFTVASGVITPSGAQTAGTYNVGGWPVEVISGYKAIANQAEFNAVSESNKGQTILIREASNITTTITWNSGADFGYATILGDGLDYRFDYLNPANDARAHFVSFTVTNIKKLTLDKLNVVTGSAPGAKKGGITIYNAGGQYFADITVSRCLVVASRPNPFGAYTSVALFPGDTGINISSQGKRVSVRDNVILGACGSTSSLTTSADGFAENIGNVVDLGYGDGIRPGSGGHLGIGGNLITRIMSKGTDTGAPHGDALQLLRSVGYLEASAYVAGDSRGDGQSFFQADATGKIHFRDLVTIDANYYHATIGQSEGSRMERVNWLPRASQTLPVSPGPMGGIRFYQASGVISGQNDIKDCVHRVASANIHGTVSVTGVVDSSAWAVSDYNAAFPDWAAPTSVVPTLKDVLTKQGQPAAGGAAANKGPRVTFAGTDNSSYLLGVPAPTLSGLTITPSKTGFSAVVKSDTDLQNIWWAVIPAGAGTPTARDIKLRKVAGALAYGDAWVEAGSTGADITLTLAAGLFPSTTYKLVMYQDNGWSVQSPVSVSTFTTSASSGISVGAAGSIVGTDSGTSLSVPFSARNSGDMLVMVICHERANGVPNTPAGWTLSGDGVGYSTASPELSIFTRITDATEGANQIVTFSGTKTYSAGMFTLPGATGVGSFSNAAPYLQYEGANTPISAAAGSAILHVWGAWPGNIASFETPYPGNVILIGGSPNGLRKFAVELEMGFAGGTSVSRAALSSSNPRWNVIQLEIT